MKRAINYIVRYFLPTPTERELVRASRYRALSVREKAALLDYADRVRDTANQIDRYATYLKQQIQKIKVEE